MLSVGRSVLLELKKLQRKRNLRKNILINLTKKEMKVFKSD
jgi:hypothetical protein